MITDNYVTYISDWIPLIILLTLYLLPPPPPHPCCEMLCRVIAVNKCDGSANIGR